MSIKAPASETAAMFDQARISSEIKDCMAVYNAWAATYNDNLADSAYRYVAPSLMAQAVMQSVPIHQDTVMLDAGCGTGLVGQALARGSTTIIDGLDLSPAMLGVARKTHIYRNLFEADMTRKIELPDQTYDIVTCCGTFTHGHVGPSPALRELTRLTKGNGLIFITVWDEIWLSGGYKTEIDRLQGEQLVNVLSIELKDYVMAKGEKAYFVVLQKYGSL